MFESAEIGHRIGKEEYARREPPLREALLTAQYELLGKASFPAIVLVNGVDGAGKGETVNLLNERMDPRHIHTHAFAGLTDEEAMRPEMWRFWRHAPARGHCVIFDRSWYGRVLVERVEGYCDSQDWMRAYHEINDFESQLSTHGGIVAKFWLAISPEEQLRRFKEREATPWKRFKITQEDWRNREKWPLYESAVCDMVDRTSTDLAPWNVIASNDKHAARLRIVGRVCELIETRCAG